MAAKTSKKPEKKEPVKKINEEIKTVPVYETHSIVPLRIIYDLLGIDPEKVMETYIEEEDVRVAGQDAMVIVVRVEKKDLDEDEGDE